MCMRKGREGMELIPEEVWYLIARRLSGRDLRRAAMVLPGWRELRQRLFLKIVCKRDLERLASVSCLTGLEITVRIHPLTNLILGVSKICTNLRELTIHIVCPLTSVDVTVLNNLPQLQHLDVFLTSRVIDEQFLPFSLKLHTLIINDSVCQNFLPALENSSISELHMMGRSHCYVQSDLRFFLNSRKDFLTSLTLRCHEMNDSGYTAIASCQNLTDLKLYSCHLLRWKSASRLVSLTKLQVLHLTGARMLWNSVLKCFLIFLKAPIEDLCLSATSFSDEHVDIVTQKFPKLKILELWRNKLSGAAVVKLTDKLKELTVLDTDLVLSEEELIKIGSHSSLSRLRCCTPYHEPSSVPQSPRVVPQQYGVWRVGAVRVLEARAPTRLDWTRGVGEGPSPSVFHYTNIDDWEEPTNYIPTCKPDIEFG